MARMTVPEYNETIIANGSNDLDSTDKSGAGGAPLAPTNFSASYLSDTSLSLAWIDNATNEDNFELDRSLTGTGGWTALADPAANATTATSTGLTVDTQYFYRLRAVNASGNSSYATANGTTTESAATILISEDFETGASVSLAVGSQAGGTNAVNLVTGDNYNNSVGSLKANYPITGGGGVFAWANGDVLPIKSTREIYIQFKAKMPSASKQGLKFCKVFGERSGDNYANATFNLNYSNGEMGSVIYGDGAGISNDAGNAVFFDGSLFGIGRSYPSTAVISTPQNANWSASNWGTSWHDFKFHVKFNSGTTALNEVADGEIYVEIDGVVYADATGLFNRHYSNGYIDYVSFFNWSQGGAAPFEVWIDNVIISEGGFV